jgi:ATP phosphoribosyltransferase regulatory subunit
MSKYKLHIPEGVQDVVGKECYIKRKIEDEIYNTFNSYGYEIIESPTFEYYDVFEDETGLIEEETMYKFFDRNGRILVLRPDITTPIARIVATKYNKEDMPLRLCYVGNAFRYNEPYKGTMLSEFTQAGMELIGCNSPEADAEVVAVTINSLINSGLKDFQIEIGHADFVNGLIEDFSIDLDASNKLKTLIDNKNSIAINEYINTLNISSEKKEFVTNLSSLFGGIEVINNMDMRVLNEKSMKALDNIKDVYNILEEYDLNKYISIDLGMVQSINYYSGIIFKGFTLGLGFPVCSGGRYDGLISNFGQNYSAMGVAIGINRLISALERNKVEFKMDYVNSLIKYSQKGRKVALKIADELRRQGMRIEMYFEECKISEICEYAKRKNIGGIIFVNDEDNLMLKNIKTGEEINTTISELLRR